LSPNSSPKYILMHVTFTIPDFDYKFRLKMSVKFFRTYS